MRTDDMDEQSRIMLVKLSGTADVASIFMDVIAVQFLNILP